jgi:hypothetical protein
MKRGAAMFKARRAVYLLAVGAMLSSISSGHSRERSPGYIPYALEQAVEGPQIIGEFLLGTASLNELTARHALLGHVAEWLSQTFNLPLIRAEPNLEQTPADELVALRYGTLRRRSVDGPTSAAPATPDPRSTVAVYVDNTIYLSKEWTGRTPADLSVLVHEMVHHIQSLGNIHDECPRAREKLAYAAQQRFLQIYERGLETEFEINPFTVLVNTTCGY